jgi:uncharacterized membrane protein YbhN (UPF0104 family)
MKQIKNLISILLILSFILISYLLFDGEQLIDRVSVFLQHPLAIVFMTVCYSLAFYFRAIAWRLYLNNKPSIKECLSGVLYSMFINHISPLKVGDAVRIGVLSKRKSVRLGEAVHSVVLLRLIDLMLLATFSSIGFFLFIHYIPFKNEVLIIFTIFIMIGILLLRWMFKKNKTIVSRHYDNVKQVMASKKGIYIVTLITLSWILEGAVVYTITMVAYDHMQVLTAIWSNSVSVISGVFQITPGGIATYESVMSVALVTAGFEWKNAYQIALISHAYKFIFSFLTGLVAYIIVPIHFKEILEWMKQGGKQTQ